VKDQLMPQKDTEDIEIRLLLEAIFLKYHYDFRNYAMASIKRRLTQACIQFGCPSISALQDRVLHDESVLPHLLSFLTVQVSELFRDPTYFKTIRERVVPHLRTYPSLKIWIAGCSSGEELYSFAILMAEEGLFERTMFYATDINPQALQKAQAGIYDLDRMKLYSESYQRAGGRSSLSDYYVADYGSARFDQNLRERVVFSDHSLVTDAVFGEMHFISCRNVLIYFDRALQNRAIGLFSDSLIRKGFLGLGAKESLRFSSHAQEFTEFSSYDKIYQKKGGHDHE
jgi:chemotaxis protein methyltransferase CheR